MLRESESIKFTLTNTNQDCLDTLGIKRSLGQRVKGVNTNLAEQVFAWFKNYAPMINEMRENRHRLLLLWLAKRHNDALLHGSASYLRSIPNSKSKTTSKSYNCSKNKKTPKGKKVKKTTMKGMKVKKVMKGMKVKGMKVKNVMKAMK